MAKTITALILTGRAAEAGEFYADLFGTGITNQVPDGQGGVLLCTLSLAGQELVIINGSGPEADIQSQRVTLQVHVDGQEEFDHYWFGLLEGGRPSQNGWLVDRFGVWWNIVPVQQMQLFGEASGSPETLARLGQAAAQMQRIDIAEMERIVRG